MPATYAVGDYFRTQEELIQTVFRVNTVLGHSCRVQRRCHPRLSKRRMPMDGEGKGGGGGLTVRVCT